MGTSDNTDGPAHGVIDRTTLYLCRQGHRWVVVLESPGTRRALPLHHAGPDAYDARFELLSRARRACPDAIIISTDGALEDADYEWRLEVRGIRARPGDLGIALHGELSASRATHERRVPRRWSGCVCHWGLSPSSAGRPRSF